MANLLRKQISQAPPLYQLKKEFLSFSNLSGRVTNRGVTNNDNDFIIGSYTGEVKEGKMFGHGKLSFDNKEIYEGGWKDNLRHGKGKMKFSSGDLYDGDWINDLRTGFGKYIWANGNIYDGEWRNGNRTGLGKYTFKDDGFYEGSFKDGNFSGEGVRIWASGDLYEGEWQDNEMSGLGKYTFKNEGTYLGYFKNNQFEGNGKRIWPDGSAYEGDWEGFGRHGWGKLIWADGDSYEGEFKWNEMTGFGTYIFKNGGTYKGYFKDGKFNGKGKRIWASGDIYDGEWKEDVKHGIGKYTWADGDVYIGEWRDGERLDSNEIENEENEEEEAEYEEDGIEENFTDGYEFPSLDLLESQDNETINDNINDEVEKNKKKIVDTLNLFKIPIESISATIGPSVTLYEIVQKAGVRISAIRTLEDDISMSLSASGIRIIAPIPGKGTIGIEIPNTHKTLVTLKSVLSSKEYQECNYSLPIAIGKRIDNTTFIADLATMPHLLIAGATGQGKSVGLNTILLSLLYKLPPEKLKLVLIDPKQVELNLYRDIENNYLAKLQNEENPIIVEPNKALATLESLCLEMDNRFSLLNKAKCRNITEYNERYNDGELDEDDGHKFFPFIVLVIDEFADLIMTTGKKVEVAISRLAQKARAVGIHLIIATQRPSVKIIIGEIKTNFNTRITFKLPSHNDSSTILGVKGAEQLTGKGDMLINNNSEITRLQCAYVSTAEVVSICEFIAAQEINSEPFYLP